MIILPFDPFDVQAIFVANDACQALLDEDVMPDANHPIPLTLPERLHWRPGVWSTARNNWLLEPLIDFDGDDVTLQRWIDATRDALKLPLCWTAIEVIEDCLWGLTQVFRKRVLATRKAEAARKRYGASGWQEIDFRPLVEALCGKGRQIGHNWRYLCPFHADRHPSLDVDYEKKTWICRACGKSGGVLAFSREAQHTWQTPRSGATPPPSNSTRLKAN